MPRDSHIHTSFSDDSNWDNMKRDRFELLSAYLDGEVTPAERQQVLQWLETDQTMQCLYARLLKLRRGIQAMPVPPSEVSVEETLTKVQARIHQRRPRRSQAVWGGAAIAALFVSAVMGSIAVPGALYWWKTGEEAAADLEATPEAVVDPEAEPPAVSTDALMITVDQPVVPIPMAIEPVEAPQSADASPELEAETMEEMEEADDSGEATSGVL